jgi:hypothetical protein
MMPGTTTMGTMLFEGMSARPRVFSAVGVNTVVVRHSPFGNGIRGGKGLVGSAISAQAGSGRPAIITQGEAVTVDRSQIAPARLAAAATPNG